MIINSIYTNRKFESWPSWDCVHEWEEDFIESLSANFNFYNYFKYKLSKTVFNKYTKKLFINKFSQKKSEKVSLAFFMDIYQSKYFFNSKSNAIPIIIDLWADQYEDYKKIFADLKVGYVTSMEVYNKINNNNLRYIPLMISDRWKKDKIDKKEIDIIQLGRRNKILHEYALKLIEKYPSIEYVYQINSNGRLHYYSNIRGDIGEFHTRKSYMDLLGKTKISLVSSPGIDNSKNTGGINPVTPRFYESAVNYCYMIGRYPLNEDFTYNEVNKVCSNVKDYEEFEFLILKSLKEKFTKYESYDRFLEPHYASNVAKKIYKELRDVNL